MQKKILGFLTENEQCKESVSASQLPNEEETQNTAKSCIASVYFIHNHMTLAYYNDKFNLKVGDNVYVDGKLEGYCGKVVGINYCFKIQLSKYHKIISIVDTNVHGKIFINRSQILTFDSNCLNYKKLRTWFLPPISDQEYACGKDDLFYSLEDLEQLDMTKYDIDSGAECFSDHNVQCLCLEKGHGYCIIKGSELYEIEFDYSDGKIGNITCSCYNAANCHHEAAAIFALKSLLETIENNYSMHYTNHAATVNKSVFFSKVVIGNDKGEMII